MVNAGRHTGSDTGQGTRAGRYLPQPEGYRAFIPAPLPPTPPVQIVGDLQRLLSEADRALGRLDGSVQTLPNPDLFVYMYVRKEAVLSSQIEGTESSLQDRPGACAIRDDTSLSRRQRPHRQTLDHVLAL